MFEALPNHMKPEQNKKIREDFRDKSKTYFEANYSGNSNPERMERLQLVREALRNLPLKNFTMLDAGAGPAVLFEVASQIPCAYFASDISQHNLESARQRVGDFPAVVADTCHLPFKDESFDVITSIGSLEYIINLNQAVSEISRVVKKNGFVITTFANRNSPARLWNEYFIRPVKQVLKGKKKLPAFFA